MINTEIQKNPWVTRVLLADEGSRSKFKGSDLDQYCHVMKTKISIKYWSVYKIGMCISIK